MASLPLLELRPVWRQLVEHGSHQVDSCQPVRGAWQRESLDLQPSRRGLLPPEPRA